MQPPKCHLASHMHHAIDNHATTSACDAAQKLYETGVDEMSWDDMDVLQAPPAYPL